MEGAKVPLKPINRWKAGAVIVLSLVIIVGLGIGGCAGIKAFNRAQRRADANNQVQVTKINIRNAQQQAKVVRAQNASVQARAEQRYLESVGVRRAQDEIAKTLTPLYVQHEAIQAQEAIAKSGRNNTSIYIPAGSNGVPLVNDVSRSNDHTTTAGK